MQGVPADIKVDEVREALGRIDAVIDVHHIHVWQLHEAFRSIEAHLVLNAKSLDQIDQVKKAAKALLRDQFRITHSTLEVEFGPESDCANCSPHQNP
jgi:cobalt-zinc-cadmium efflux system protein